MLSRLLLSDNGGLKWTFLVCPQTQVESSAHEDIYIQLGIVLSMVAAGLLVSVSANMMEDALAKFKAGADLAKVLEKVEEKQEKAAEKFKKVLAGQTD